MSDVASLIADMVRAGVDPEIIGRTAAALSAREPVLVADEQAERRREKDRIRKAEARLRKSAESAEDPDAVSPKKEIPPTPPKEKTTPSTPVVSARAEFDDFWSLFPNKVGKRDAEKAFANARRRADLEAILAGVRRYAAKTDDRPWCNPATFLNQDRWGDQPAAKPMARAADPPPKKMTVGESFRQLARERGILDATGSPAGRLETGDRSREDPIVGYIGGFAVTRN